MGIHDVVHVTVVVVVTAIADFRLMATSVKINAVSGSGECLWVDLASTDAEVAREPDRTREVRPASRKTELLPESFAQKADPTFFSAERARSAGGAYSGAGSANKSFVNKSIAVVVAVVAGFAADLRHAGVHGLGAVRILEISEAVIVVVAVVSAQLEHAVIGLACPQFVVFRFQGGQGL